MAKTKYHITEKYLVKGYSRNKKSLRQIADIIGCGVETVRRNLTKYNIPIRETSEALKGKYVGKNSSFFGKHHTEATKMKISQNRVPIEKRKGYNPERHKKHYCKEKDCNNEICYDNWRYGGSRRCQSCASRIWTTKHWQDRKYVTKVMRARLKALSIKPNKPEKRLNNLLQKILPKEYKYVGDWKFVIGRYNPDFVNCNGQKKIIELYGDYWHNLPSYKKRDKRRLVTYKKYGYKTLIIWQRELKDLGKVMKKILAFNSMGAK